jgi:hypothetical protein
MEIAEESRKKTIREMAEKQIDESHDAVKLLQSMGQRAVAFTIRDQQLEEKKRLVTIYKYITCITFPNQCHPCIFSLHELEKQMEKRTDMMMELDRLKDIQRREEEEMMKRTKRIEDRSVINDQIAARQKTRLLQLEAREQENVAMRNLMKKYEQEDQQAAERRKVEIER